MTSERNRGQSAGQAERGKRRGAASGQDQRKPFEPPQLRREADLVDRTQGGWVWTQEAS